MMLIRLSLIQLRKRIDTRAALTGWVLLVLAMIGCVVIVLRASGGSAVSFVELVSAAGLPLAVGGLFIGVAFGVGDAAAAGERDELLAGHPRLSTLGGRLIACLLALVGAVVTAMLVACSAAAVGVLGGTELRDPTIGSTLAEVAWLSASGVLSGFAIGAALRSFAFAIGVALVGALVVDTALGFAGAWGSFLRLSSLQGLLSQEGLAMPAISAFGIWVLLPLAVGVIRTLRVNP